MCEKVRVGLRLQPSSIAGEGRPNTTLPIRNRLAVRIAGSHPADRGSIPRYGRCNKVFSLKMADSEIPTPKIFFLDSF